MSHAAKSFRPVSDRWGFSRSDDRRCRTLPVKAVRVLNTCLYLGFRADLADREEVEIR